MKTPALLSRATQSISRFAAICRRVPELIFGNVSWRAPRWLSRALGVWGRLECAYPRSIGPAIIALVLLSCAAAWTWNWYSHRPKPHRVTAKVGAISVTRLEQELKFPPLTISFSESAARLEDLKKQTLPGVRLEPQVSGSWHWASDSVLVFQPTEDWPADQKYRVIFEKKFFPRHVLMERLVYEAQAPPFEIALQDLQFYQDPTNPAERQVTATLALTHSVEPKELERHVELAMIGGSTIFRANDPAPHFSLSYGLHRRLVSLRTSSIALPEREDFLKLVLSKGVRTSQGGAKTRDTIEQKVSIPSFATVFRIDSIVGTVARNKNGEPEQLLVLNTTSDIPTRDLAKAVEIWMLPKRPSSESAKQTSDADDGDEHDAEDGESDESEESSAEPPEDSSWESAADVPEEVLDHVKRVAFTALPSDKTQDRQHVLRVRVDADGELYLRIRKGLRAPGDYSLAEDYNAVVRVPELPLEVQIEGQGGLLALNGERKLSIRSRGMAGIEYEIARVGTTQINHLVSQTEGQFEHPHFQDSNLFDEENISRLALEHQTIAIENKWKANYSAFDFSEHLRKPADGGSERGLFFLTARGWDPEKKKAIKSIKDRRFILITDIGILTKKNADGSNDVFLMSIKSGRPIGGAVVDVLGKNGIALQTSRTDTEGRCSFTSLEKSTRDKTPVAFVARNGDDTSFIPYAREDRVLNFSRFDVDGVENVLPENLDAFVFTERGVYRPGDEVHIGLVVKQRNWQSQIKGLPLETEVIDARGLRVQSKKISLTESGFTELSFQTANESPTGLYTFNVYLVKNSKRATLLGSTTANVKEFLPDRMKIDTRLSKNTKRGWVSPKEMRASIFLANLYGTPATDRRVAARVELTPAAFSFPEFRDFMFFDPLIDEKKQRHPESIDLGEKKTNGYGQTDFDLQLERFADATYAMQFIAEGFESEGGRSVTGDVTALVSALPYVVGCKTGGDLRYIEMGKPRTIELIALDSQLNRIAVENITLNVIAREFVSVLTKQNNGNYVYESVLKERVTKSEKIAISANGLSYALPNSEPGTYLFELRDDQDRRLSKLQFCVVGRGAASRSLEKNSELEVKLNKAQYSSGDEIEVSITAPYAGSGLITIERDKVYAHQWFQANSASSVQRIRVPETFEGSGYINVAFVRSLDSKEIFVSPLSYGVVPFTANLEKRRLKIDIDAPALTKPGEPLRIQYKTDRPGKILIFAVDQGILQVTDYKTPDPLAFFFRKCALHVETAQIVDLIIPEFSLLRSVSAFGGGDDAQRLNPFKRVTDKPVVFWSGILETGPTSREIVYDVPDFFDGNLRIMAVSVSNDATGAAERDALVRGPFVVTPSVPVLAAPGDEFEAGVTVANNVEGSGADAEIELRAETNERLSIVQAPFQKLRIAEGREQSAVFRFRANDKLGAGEIRFIASRNGTETQRRATLSVRPPMPFMTTVRSGSFTKSAVDVPITRTMLPEFRKLDAAVSAVPLGLAHGLDVYLKNFPHGCSEQITSGAFCRLMLAGEADFGLSRAEINQQLEHTFSVLARRQNDQGSFGYWTPENGTSISFVSVYVMDFLAEAKAAGFAPPPDMFANGLRNLQKMVARTPSDLSGARVVAYAIYVLTREGIITTNYILNLRDYLEKNQRGAWENDATGVYLAGALKLLHKDGEADRLIDKYKIDNRAPRISYDFYQPLGANSQYLAVIAREFPARLKKISAGELEAVLKPIGDGYFNTLSAAYAVRALKSYSHAMAQAVPELSIAEVHGDKREVRLASGEKLLQRSNFSGDAAALRFQAASRINGSGTFFQVIEAGFDRQVPSEPLNEGLEVYRELIDKAGQPVTSTKLGEAIRVRLHVRSLRGAPVTNVAIVDLLPGGFEIVDTSLRGGTSSISGVDYVDLREDRAVFFVTAPTYALEIDYQIKSCNRGEFVLPPVFAESMYDRNVKGRGVGGKITVTE
jgi:uncharacterized protein YfaS (alpha-2-macroglobulin family)